MNEQPSEGLATPKEVGDYLGLSEGALAQMRFNHCGPTFIKLGRRSVRYDWRDIFDWVDKSRIFPMHD
jgi:predicted DNA-binding transcriptional regulator AlpA